MKPIKWISPLDICDDIFWQGDALHLSNIDHILSRPIEREDFCVRYTLESLLNDSELLKEYQLLLILPLPQGPHLLFEDSRTYNIWMNLLGLYLRVMVARPDSRLVVGCDWDEYNVASYKHDNGSVRDLITEIFNALRQHQISLRRLTWLYCNPMIPDWVAERVGQDEQLPQTIYHSYYLRRLKDLHSDFQPDISENNVKTHWLLSLNRRIADHRTAFCFGMYCNTTRPNNISCRLTKSASDHSISDYFEGEHGYRRVSRYYSDKETYSFNKYQEFYNTLPWSIDNPSSSEGLWIGLQDSFPKSIVHSSACYFPTETHFEDIFERYQGWISEKSLKSFFYGLPTVWVAPHNTLRSIKKLGFQNYARMINEDYDCEPNPYKRMEMIIAEANRIQAIDDIDAWYRGGMDIYQHNRARLQQLMDQDAAQMIEDFHYGL